MIFSEMELVVCYKVSQGIVCKVIDELVVENLVVWCQGKGIFVIMYYEEGVQFWFLCLMLEQGEQYYLSSCVLECKCMCVLVEIVCLFEFKVGDSVVQICCILFFLGELIVLEEIWLLGVSFKGLMVEKLIEWKGLMYVFFEVEFGVCMLCVIECICVVVVDVIMVELFLVVV